VNRNIINMAISISTPLGASDSAVKNMAYEPDGTSAAGKFTLLMLILC
jgi:hypothetical protein